MMWQNSYDGKNILYLIPTPIGNLEDITIRSLNILKKVKIIFSEDTRVAAILLNNYNIKAKLYSLHDHNEDKIKDKVLSFLKNGQDVAIITDRGTPIISDPGYKTVEYVSSNGYNVVSLPGATAFVPALTSSGINPQPFLFYGFLNSRESKRNKELEKLKDVEFTMIFYEAPHRIYDTLKSMYNIFGDRKISISREISKKFESVYRGNIKELLDNDNSFKGEFVIVVEGKKEEKGIGEEVDVVMLVNEYAKKGHSISESIKYVAKTCAIAKNTVYSKYYNNGERKQ